MSAFYTIEQPVDKLYVHFNPKTREYFVGDKIVGACLFHKPAGRKFIKKHLDDSWKLIKSNHFSQINS